MPKYNPAESEKKWQQFWLDNHVFKFDPKSDKPIYSIDTPPPTISGKLHIGHVFSYTQTEVLARYFRLAGYNVYYPFGMDDNGLPTERLVETELNIKAPDLSRNDFIQKCLDTVGIYHQKYRDLWQSLGFSVDWDMEYSTISAPVRKLTQANFLELYHQGLIYRKLAPALWCPQCLTSVAQAEVEDKQMDSVFYNLVFKDDTNQELIVSTTRPELLPAIVAVFVNPKDKRFQKLVGTMVTTPLGDKVKVYTDDKAQIDKGTGIVMCCTYGDETDLFWKNQYSLDEKIILDKQGLFNKQCSYTPIVGKNITEGRQIIVNYLNSQSLIKSQKSIVHDVGVHERCSTPIEIINTDQWFVKVLDIKDELQKIADNINWFPKTMKHLYLNWVTNLKWDWNISRDRFYGISVPVFYCPKCSEIILPSPDELPIDPLSQTTTNTCPKCHSSDLTGEHLVFDTWFTSGNSPEINLKLNQSLTDGKITIPMSLRPQAHDIIRTWTFYTIVLSYYKNKQAPWKDIAISGHILLRRGEKISKRTGGGSLRPEEQIALHSADAIRFAMCAASLGLDAYYDDQEIEMGKKLVNKLYNAANFCFKALEDYRPQTNTPALQAFDRWIIQTSCQTASEMAKYFEKYDYSHARNKFMAFFWQIFCDYYLEIIKKRIYEFPSGSPEKISAQFALFQVLLDILKMASPFVPHITEELYQSYYRQHIPSAPVSLHQTLWPSKSTGFDQELDKVSEEIINIITAVRTQKTKSGLNLGQELSTVTLDHPTLTTQSLEPFLYDLLGVTRSSDIKLVSSPDFKVSITVKK
jgi:valyl-tRNA synthetase